MRRILILAIALLVLASSANAYVWTGTLASTAPTNPPGWIQVTVNADLTAGLWDWTYDLTPTGLDATHTAYEISAFSLNVGAAALSAGGGAIVVLPSSNAALGWTSSTTGNSIQWTVPPGSVLAAASTGRFEFTSKWGPSADNWGYALDHGTYAGLVPTPGPTGSPPPPPGWNPPDGTVLDVRNPYAGYTVAKRVKGQLHCHYYNDAERNYGPIYVGMRGIGSWTPECLLTAYAALGYDFVCITEHNHCTTQPLVFQSRFVSNCEEATMSFAHVLALGTTKTGCATRKDELRNYPWDSFNQLGEVLDAAPNDLKEAVNTIHSPAYGNGLAIVAHPNAGCKVSEEDIRKALPDAMSIWTAASFSSATDKWDNLLKSGVFLPHISGNKMLLYGASEDDFTPTILPWAFGRTWVVAELEETTADQANFMKALRNGRYWTYYSCLANIGPGPVLQLTTSQNADGKEVISVTSSVSTKSIQFIGLKKDEGVKVLSSGSGTSAEYVCNGSELYIRVEVCAGNVIACSQPIALAWNYASNLATAKALSTVSSQSASPASTPSDIVFACALPEQLPDVMPPQGYIGRAYFVSATTGVYAPDATFTLSYEGQDVTPYGTSNLAIFRWDAVNTQLAKLTSTVDSGGALVTATLTQEGLYTISAEITGDTTAPTVTIYHPAGGATLTGPDVVGVWAYDNVGVQRVSFYLNDQCIGTDSSGWDGYACEYDFGKKAAGAYMLIVEAEDVTGNRGSAQVTVNIASSGVAPVLTMPNPANGANLTGTVTVSGTCADNTLVTGVFVIADGIPVGEAAITGGNWSFNLNTAKLADGPHSLSAMVMDEDQNTYEQGISVNISGAVLPSLSAAKSLDDGQQARFGGRVVTFGDPGDDGAFYVEELDRFSGIRVQGRMIPAEGDFVTASGIMTTVDGERTITGADVLVQSSSNTVPGPLGMQGAWLGGGALGLQPGITGAFGLNNIGLLVRTCGKAMVSESVDVPIRSWAFASDPGWDRGGEWAFGSPAGGGRGEHGHPDPIGGHNQPNVFGVNLGGDYSTVPGGPWYLIAGPVDCSNQPSVYVRFWRWLNSDYQPYVYATIEASNDGSHWVQIWSNGHNEIADADWVQCEYDISSVASNQPAVYLRWGYRICDGAYRYSGWNIDGVAVVRPAQAGSKAFWIDDGSNVSTKVITPAGVTLPAAGDRVIVTGISSCERVGEELHRLLRVRTQEDITVCQ